MPRLPAARQGERGFALVLVLWTAALLALLGTRITSGGRTAALVARNLVTAAELQASADAGVELAIFRLLGAPRATGAEAVVPAGVVVEVENEAGKINPNIASAELLQGLLLAAGDDPGLADRILDWRTGGRYPRRHGAKAAAYEARGRSFGPPGRPIRDLDELTLVLGLTPAIVADLKPDLTLTYRGDPVPAVARPRVRAALAIAHDLGQSVTAPLLADRAQAYCITATAYGAGGSEARRRACVRLDRRLRGVPWRIVTWTAG